MKAALQNKSDPGKIFEFTPRDFARVRAMIYQQAGISLSESKQEMVYSRLTRRLRAGKRPRCRRVGGVHQCPDH